MISFVILTSGLAALILALLVSFALTASKLKVDLPPDNPERWLAVHGKPADRPPRGRPIVVCAGDSITHGVVSADWVAMMRARMPDAEFVNAGVNSELAWNLHQRLDPIVAIDPDFIVVLIGSNDANATLGFKSTIGYMANQGLPELPSPSLFRETLTLIVRRLKTETSAAMALASIPPIFEEPDSHPWMRTAEYAGYVKDIAKAEDVGYLPFRERLVAYLESAPRKRSIPYETFQKAIRRAMWDHRMLGKSWDEISAANGFHLLVDGIHLNTHGATVLADLAEKFIRDGRRAARAGAPGATVWPRW